MGQGRKQRDYNCVNKTKRDWKKRKQRKGNKARKGRQRKSKKVKLEERKSHWDLQAAWSCTMYQLYQQLSVKPGVLVMSTSHAWPPFSTCCCLQCPSPPYEYHCKCREQVNCATQRGETQRSCISMSLSLSINSFQINLGCFSQYCTCPVSKELTLITKIKAKVITGRSNLYLQC